MDAPYRYEAGRVASVVRKSLAASAAQYVLQQALAAGWHRDGSASLREDDLDTQRAYLYLDRCAA